MKKKLRNILVLSLGLITTIASAQFSANSTSRINNTDSDNKSIDNRIAVSADYGAVHVSADVNAATDGSDASYAIYEAYASTDLMGLGTLTIGRQDLSFGSGALMSGSDWNLTDRNTEDGVSFNANFGGFDISLGSLGGIDYGNQNYMNASGNFGGANFNVLMMANGDDKAHGYDLSYSMNSFAFGASMNSDFNGAEYTAYGLTYNVSDNLSASFGRTTYGADIELTAAIAADTNTGQLAVDAVMSGGFNMANTNTAQGWAAGNMGYLNANDEATTMAVSYDLGGITISYSMTTVSNDDVENDREVTIMSLAYQLNDNCNIGLSRFSDSDEDGSTGWDGGERTYVSLSIGL